MKVKKLVDLAICGTEFVFLPLEGEPIAKLTAGYARKLSERYESYVEHKGHMLCYFDLLEFKVICITSNSEDQIEVVVNF